MTVHLFPFLSRLAGCVLSLSCAIPAVACSGSELAGLPPSSNPSCGGELLRNDRRADKLDLVFVVDNSPSMADKQAILADAVPDLVSRFTNPVCVDRATRAYVASPAPGDECPDYETQEREFEPINDIHIGVISSSLGGHGADSCSEIAPDYNPRQEDMSRLLSRGKNPGETSTHEVPTWQNKGFLNWDPEQWDDPPGTSSVDTLVQGFSELVRGAGDDGCGFESTLEAWYRFLADPEPYARMVPCPCNDGDTAQQCRCADGVDTVVLQQRADMIRQDSLLAIIMLSDENDCSIKDGGQNFLALQALDGTQPFHVARGTNACQIDPWAPDCKSCWEVEQATHPECQSGWANAEKDDPANLRCFDQERRFGINFLQPIRRYVDALTERRFADNTLNPVFCAQYATKPNPNDPSAQIVDRENCAGSQVLRDPSTVFLAGIVGVPWQDIARDPNDLTQGYRTAGELIVPIAKLENPPTGVPYDATLWDVILGETRADGEIVPTSVPLDPLMIESVDPRSGSNPITGDVLAPTATGPLINSVNGSERDISSRDELQYACIFKLPTPIDCAAAPCDCETSPENPLCYDEVSGTFTTTQYRAKAFPARRQLAVLKGIGDQAIVASICPATVDASRTTESHWGYRPAIAAIVDRLKGRLQSACFDPELSPDDEGKVACTILEATFSNEIDASGNVICPPCQGVRSPPDGQAAACTATESDFVEIGLDCLCELRQFSEPDALRSCIQDTHVDPSLEGWCYLDANQNPLANKTLLASCPSNQKRLVRFVGHDVPKRRSLVFMRCKAGAV